MPVLVLCTLPADGLRSRLALKLTAFGALCALLVALHVHATGYTGHLTFMATSIAFAVFYMFSSHMHPMKALFWFFSAMHFITFCVSVSNVMEFILIGDSMPYITLEFTFSFIILQLLLLPVIYYLLKHYFLPIFKKAETTQNLWLLFCLPVSQLAICALISEIYDIRNLPLNLMFLLINIISYFGTLASYLLCARLLSVSLDAARLSERLAAFDLLIDNQKEQYAEQARSYERLRALRHDLRYQVAALRTRLDEGDLDGMRAYLDGWLSEVDASAPAHYSDHPAVNILVQAMFSVSKVSGVRAQIQLPLQGCGLADTDLCVLIGNCLQNALDGCATVPESERFVEMRASRSNDQLTLLVRNSFDGVTRADGDDLLSRRRDYSRSGVGMTSIRKIVEHYMGVMKIEHTGSVFTLMIYLQPLAVERAQA